MEDYSRSACILFVPFRDVEKELTVDGSFLLKLRKFVAEGRLLSQHARVLQNIQDCWNSLNGGRPEDCLERFSKCPCETEKTSANGTDEEQHELTNEAFANILDNSTSIDSFDCPKFRNWNRLFSLSTSQTRDFGRQYVEINENAVEFIVVKFHVKQYTVDAIVLVAHNGRAFDILLRSLQRQSLLVDDPRYGYFIDTLHVARTFLGGSTARPTDNRLGTLFQFVTGAEMENSHRAMGDVKALYTVFRSAQFWGRRTESLKAFPPIQAVVISTESDSDESDSDADSVEGGERVLEEQDIDESDPKNEDVDEILGDYWQEGEFIPSEVPEEMFQKFNDCFSSPRRPGERRPGLQVSAGMANSPIKAWRLIFTTAILERIVKHTNAYGQKKLNLNWTPIDKADLTDFIAVLFVMSIQKRKDKPSNWISSNPLLHSSVAKKITTGRQFQKMLRYLHCCDPNQNATSHDGDYDPSYKILEFKESLEKRWHTMCGATAMHILQFEGESSQNPIHVQSLWSSVLQHWIGQDRQRLFCLRP
ncbi:transposase IS4 [Nitzschia inconspicua]|uniref:Transposase IS4 n=1 Tax=Nitzschia inconspicua TaxID=303405 RepID=A0A9K3KCE6_9STRA|nr:transposase IS4 [Nitzschia inconspicua]